LIYNPGGLLGLVISGQDEVCHSQTAYNNKYDSCDTHLAFSPRRDHSILPLLFYQRTSLRKRMSYPPPFRKRPRLIILC
jgi:hypothetical protein